MKYSTNLFATFLLVLSALSAKVWAQQADAPVRGLPNNSPVTGQQQYLQPANSFGAGSPAQGRVQSAPANTTQTNLSAAVSTTVPTNPAEIPWLRSATEAAMQSQATGKPILVYVRSQNCHYCDLLQKNTWQDQATKARVMREMIPLKLTLEENKEAIEAMKVKGFPSVIIFSPRREYLGRIDGYVTPEQFQGQFAKAMLAHQSSSSTPVKR